MTSKQIRLLNEMLGRGLGRNPYGYPLYCWGYSEDMIRDMVVDGKFNWTECPVLDEQGAWTGKTLYQPAPVIAKRKLAWWLDRQWVMTKWMSIDRDEWNRTFCGLSQWPSRGEYIPVGGSDLEPGAEPDKNYTESFIWAMNHQREKTMQDHLDDVDRIEERDEKAWDSRAESILNDCSNAFASAKPGSRGEFYSVPSKESTEHHDTAFANQGDRQ